VFALKTLAAYGWGNPISQSAVHLLDHRRGEGEDTGEVVIELIAGADGAARTFTLEELAAVPAKPAPAAPTPTRLMIEDMRPQVLEVDIAEAERLLAQTRAMADRLEADNARKRKLLEEREPGVIVLDLDE
jgi:hypothetical protein